MCFFVCFFFPLQKIIDVVKFDIEGHEWTALNTMLYDTSLQYVKQIMFEIHLHLESKSYATDLKAHSLTLKRLQKLGFKRYLTHLNLECTKRSKISHWIRTQCIEMYYINSNFLKFKLNFNKDRNTKF